MNTEREKTLKESNATVVLTGLALGEETKGAAVQYLTRLLGAHTNIRMGGCNCGHMVVISDDVEQMFSHFGSGTFEGAGTYLSEHMTVFPTYLFEEAMDLEKKGVKNPLDKIAIDKKCVVIAPYHGAFDRLKEISRGSNKRGTVGMGVSDAVEESRTLPELSIRAGEFLGNKEALRQKVEEIRQYKLKQAKDLLATIAGLSALEKVQEEIGFLEDKTFVPIIVQSFLYLADLVKIVDDKYLDELLAQKGAIVCEPSHGALHHPRQGFVPHITQVDPTSQDLMETLRQHNPNRKIVRLGVSRCYLTRHGAGPLVSFNQEMTDQIEENENHNAKGSWWLGEFRNGNYDVIALRYAIQISGGRETFDGLMISYLDVLNKFDQWQVVEEYTLEGEPPDDLDQYFDLREGKIIGIKFHPDSGDQSHFDHQIRLTQLLKQCKPVLKTLKSKEGKTLEQVFLQYVEEKLNIPVVAVAHGPRAEDRELLPGYESLFV